VEKFVRFVIRPRPPHPQGPGRSSGSTLRRPKLAVDCVLYPPARNLFGASLHSSGLSGLLKGHGYEGNLGDALMGIRITLNGVTANVGPPARGTGPDYFSFWTHFLGSVGAAVATGYLLITRVTYPLSLFDIQRNISAKRRCCVL
jgi:hypothetical protein